MKLFVETQGRGPDLVMIHGWGLHGGIWGDLPTQLARDFRVSTVDLPGHGRSPLPEEAITLRSLTDSIVGQVGEPAVWIGWSLGGLVAVDAARRHAESLTKLVLIGATPKFVQGPGWPGAMAREVFAEFGASLARDYRATLLRFLSLQVGSDDESRVLIKRLRSEMFAHGEPSTTALAAGLDILESTDLRDSLSSIRMPTLVVHGSHDRLAPPAAGGALAAGIPGARHVLIDGAGHAPFLSRPAVCLDVLRSFLA